MRIRISANIARIYAICQWPSVIFIILNKINKTILRTLKASLKSLRAKNKKGRGCLKNPKIQGSFVCGI